MSKTKKKLPIWLDITFKVVEWTLIIFIVVCMLILLSQKITGNTPELFGYSTYTVVTDSMAGTYDVGDVVLCKRTKNALEYNEKIGYKEGDVIAFIAPKGFDKGNKLQGRTVTHRIVQAPYYNEEDDTWYVRTKGDAAVADDATPIPVENIQGIIVGTSKAVSKTMMFVTKWYGFTTLVVIPLLLILVWQIAIIAKEKTKEVQENLEKQNKEELQRAQQERIDELKVQAIQEYQAKLGIEDNIEPKNK